jgi:hypothetical protein
MSLSLVRILWGCGDRPTIRTSSFGTDSSEYSPNEGQVTFVNQVILSG